MNRDTLLSLCLRTSPYIPLRSMYGYVVRLLLPPIRTIFQKVSFSDITLQDTRITSERKYLHGSTAPPHHTTPIPAETVSGPRVRPRHAVTRNRNHCEGSARVWYRTSCFGTCIYSRFRYCRFSVETPPLPRTYCIFGRVVLSSNQH